MFCKGGASSRFITALLFILPLFIVALSFYASGAGIDVVSPVSPANGSAVSGNLSATSFAFNYTGENSTASCELFIDGAGYGVNASVPNVITSWIEVNNTISEGTHSWNVNCTNETETLVSDSWIFSFHNSTVASCGNLSGAGTYYLQNDVSAAGTCFNVTANDVIIDCDGHAINYSDTLEGYGVSVNGYDNLTVRNCRIYQTSGSFSGASAIRVVDSHNDSFINNTLKTKRYNSYSMYLYDSDATLIENNTIDATDTGSLHVGLYYYQPDDAMIRNNTITTRFFGSYGIHLNDPDNATLESNDIRTPDELSLYIETSGDFGPVSIDTTNLADGLPIFYNESIANVIVIANANVTAAYGQVICVNCTNVTYENVTMGSDGMMLVSSVNSTLTGLYIVSQNSSSALRLQGGSGMTVENSSFSAGSSQSRSFYSEADDSVLRNSRLFSYGEARSCVQLTGADRNVLSNNTYVFTPDTTSYGALTITFSSNNSVTGGTATVTGGLADIYYGCDGNGFSDMDAYLGSARSAVSISDAATGASTFTNVTFNTTNLVSMDTSTMQVEFYEYADVNVTNGTGSMLSGAAVSAYDVNGTLRASNTSSSSILTRLTVITDLYNSTQNDSYNNYTFYAALVNYTSASASRNVTNSSVFTGTSYVSLSLNSSVSCGAISSPGVYTLTQDVSSSGTCFTVSAQNVTLDCQGHTITYSTGGASDTYGIYSTQFNTTVMNCNVLDGNRTSGITSRYGILFQGAENGTIYNTTVNASSYAIRFFGADYSVINGSTAVSSAASIYMYSSMNNTVYNTTCISSGGYGFYLLESHNNTISFLVASSNTTYGVDVASSYYNTFINASASSSANTGFHAEDGYSKLYNCTGTSTGTSAGSHGMRIVGNANTVSYSTGTAVFGAGIYLNLAYNNTVSNCKGTSNTSRGILLDAATDNVISDSTWTSNTSAGISLNANSNNNTLSRNTGSSNMSAGIFIYSSSGNTLSSNTGTSVSDVGLSLYIAADTTITGQVALTTGTIGAARYAVVVRATNGTVMRDCANVSGGTRDVYVYNEGISQNNTFVNCSYSLSKELVSGANSQLSRAWYFDANVTDEAASPLEGANLTIYNYTSGADSSLLTDASGNIDRAILTDYVNTGGTRTYATPHTVNVTKIGYTTNSTGYNVTSLLNVFATITLEETSLNLTGCGPLSVPGAYQTLLNNVTADGTCFNITADDVILDCNGYWINYSASTLGYAVYSSGYNNITVKGCGMIHNLGRDYADAVQFINSDGSTILNNTITIDSPSGDQGIYAYGTWNLLIENNTITAGGGYSGSLNDGHGIYVVQGGNATVRNNTITNTVDIGGHGIALEWTRNCTLRSNTMQNADSFSLYVEGYSPSYAAHDIDMSNTADGKAVYYNQSLSDITVLANQDVSGTVGQAVCFGCTNVTYQNVTMAGDGILLSYANNSLVNASRIVTSTGPAAYVRMGQNNTISSTYMSKSATGMPTIYLDYTYGFTLRDSAVYDTAPSESVTILDSNDNSFTNNTVISTSGDVAGITLSTGNTFTGGYLYGGQWLIGVSTSTVNMTDLTINTSGTYMSQYGSSGRLNLFNVTIADASKAMVGDASSEAYAYEYVDVNVTNSSSMMVSGVTIRAYDSNQAQRGISTSSSAALTRFTVPSVFYNSTHNSSYSNYTFYANLSGYINASAVINVTDSSAYTAGNALALQLFPENDPPDLNFVPPTLPNSSYTQNYTWVYINVSGYENLSACILQNGTLDTENISMVISGQACYYNMTGQSNQTQLNFRVYANDTWGNLNVTEWRNVTVNLTAYYDTEAPDLDFITPASNGSYTQNASYVFVNVSSTETLSACLLENGTAGNITMNVSGTMCFYNITGQSNLTQLDFRVYGNDTWGNINATGWRRATVNITVFDMDPPDPFFVPPTLSNNSRTQNESWIYVNVSAAENLSSCILGNATGNQTMELSSNAYCYLNITGLSNQTSVYFRVYANDTWGNLNVTPWRNITVNLTDIYPDITSPDISITLPQNSTSSSDAFSFTYASDVYCSAYSVDGAANVTNCSIAGSTWNGSLSVASDGAHNVTVYANDSSGNLNSTSRYWIRDTDAPDIFNATNSTIYPILAYITWNVTGSANASLLLGTNASLLSVNASNASYASSWNLTAQYLAKNTTYYYNVTSCDAAGNCNTTGSYNFTTPDCNASSTCGSWSTCSSSSQSRTCTDANHCSYPWETTQTQSCDDGGGNSGSSGTTGSTPAPVPANRSSELSFHNESDISSSQNLMTAFSLATGYAVDDGGASEISSFSSRVTSDFSGERSILYFGGKTVISTEISYGGAEALNSTSIYAVMPKEFASSASLVNVSAPGASVSVVEDDPSWLITYPSISPGDTLYISYQVSGTKNSSLLEEVRTEVYAVPPVTGSAIDTPIGAPSCTPLAIACTGGNIQRCSEDGMSWETQETCDMGCDPLTNACVSLGSVVTAEDAILAVVIALECVLIAAAFYVLRKTRKKSKDAGKDNPSSQENQPPEPAYRYREERYPSDHPYRPF